MSLTCDLTGNNPLFKLYGLRYRINKPAGTDPFILTLPQTGYAEGVVIKKINAENGLDTLVAGIDFEFTEADRDLTSESLVASAYTGFGSSLYKSVRILSHAFGSAAYIDIILEFQSVFPNVLTSALDQEGNPSGPVCTPELLRQILEDIIFLKGVAAGEDINYSTAQSLPSPLATDYTGVLDDNFIQDEAHIILAHEGKVVIRPANGAFYDHDLVVRDSNHTPLVRERDYTVRGMDIAATKVCEHESGVWRYIIIEKNITGTVYISYHAFGGEVNVQNFLSIRDQVQALKDYIDRGSFLTANTIGGTPLLQEIVERINTLDRYYMSLNMSGYKDMSNRYTALPATTGSTSSGWYRVAYLYKQTNSTGDSTYMQTFTKDSVRLKLRLEISGVVLDLFVYANVLNSTLKLTVMESDDNINDADPSDYSKLETILLPKFRLVWRTDDDYNHGAVLQIKLQPGETVEVENHNKAGLGGWILRGDINGTDEVSPENDSVVLPDGVTLWNANGNSSTYKSVEAYPGFRKGTLFWAGAINLSKWNLDNPSKTSCVSPAITHNVYDCMLIKQVTIVIFDRLFHVYIKKTVSVNATSSQIVNCNCIFDEIDGSWLECYLETTSPACFIFAPHLGTKSDLIHRFDLRQVYIHTTGEL